MARICGGNDPLPAGRGWASEFLWPSCRDSLGYTTACALLAFAAVRLFRGTGQGILELCTCGGMCFLDLFTIFSEASARSAERKRRSLGFLGTVMVKGDAKKGDVQVGEWAEVPGIDLQPGDLIKLGVGSVVPADVRWVSGAALVVDSSYAQSGDHRSGGGVGGDSGIDLSCFVRLTGSPAAGTSAAASTASASLDKGTLRQRKGSAAAKASPGSKTVVGGVTIEDASDSDDADGDGVSGKAGGGDCGAKEQVDPFAGIPTADEAAAGGMVVVLDASSSTPNHAVVEVVRVGTKAHGWQRAAARAAVEEGWRRAKRSSLVPTQWAEATMLAVGLAVALGTPLLLAARSEEARTGYPAASLAEFAQGVLANIKLGLGLEDGFFDDYKGYFKLPGFMSGLGWSSAVGAGGWAESTGFGSVIVDPVQGADLPSSSGGDAGAVSEDEVRANRRLLGNLVCVDQVKALLHLGIVVVGHSTLGARLLLSSAESACQRFCAKRGALLKPRSTGLTSQRVAEVDTVVLAHFDPRAVSREDAHAVARLRSLHGVDVKVLHLAGPAPAAKAHLSRKAAGAAAAGAGAAPSAKTIAEAAARASAATGGAVSAAEFALAAAADEVGGNSGGGHGQLGELLKSLGLPETVADATEASTFAAGPQGAAKPPGAAWASCAGLLVPLAQADGDAWAAELGGASKRHAAWRSANAERRAKAPNSVPVPRPPGCLLPRVGVGAAAAAVKALQRAHGRSVLVTCDDAFDGRTLPLLYASHVGVVTGNTHLTAQKKKANKQATVGGSVGPAKTPAPPAAGAGPGAAGAAFGAAADRAAAEKPSAAEGGDVALGTGLPLGLSPLCDMLVACRATARLEHSACLARLAMVAGGASLLLLQVADSSALTTSVIAETVPAAAAAASTASASASPALSAFAANAALAVGSDWASSVVRRGVVFGASMRLPLSLLLPDVLLLFACTPEPPDSNARGVTETILAESSGRNKQPDARTGRHKLSRLGFAGRAVAHAAFGSGGSFLFRSFLLPVWIPMVLPHLRPLLEDSAYIFSMVEDPSDAAAAGGAAGGKSRVGFTGVGGAGGGSQSTSADAPSVFAQQADAMARGAGTGGGLTAVDRDTCAFLFLLFAGFCTATAGLVMARASWRTRLALVATFGLPTLMMGFLLLATNGMVGGVEVGGDPAAAIATLAFCVVYHFAGGCALGWLLPAYP